MFTEQFNVVRLEVLCAFYKISVGAAQPSHRYLNSQSSSHPIDNRLLVTETT